MGHRLRHTRFSIVSMRVEGFLDWWPPMNVLVVLLSIAV